MGNEDHALHSGTSFESLVILSKHASWNFTGACNLELLSGILLSNYTTVTLLSYFVPTDSSMLLTACDDMHVNLYDVENKALVESFSGGSTAVRILVTSGRSMRTTCQ